MMLWLEDNLESKKMVIQRAALFSIATLFILFVFQPFGTINSTISYKFLRLSGYGLVTFCGLLLAGTLEIILSRKQFNRRLRLFLVCCLYVGITAAFNHSYFVVSIIGSWHWQNQLLFVLYTLAIGVFPISISYLINRYANRPIEPQVAQTNNISPQSNEPIATQVDKNIEVPLIILTGDNKGDELQVSLTQLLFIKSADNYCELAIYSDNKVSTKLLRCSLTRILKQLTTNSLIHRCHRSYAVNLTLVELSTGNAGGLQLLMKPIGVTVPVSRSYVDVIKKALLLAPKAC